MLRTEDDLDLLGVIDVLGHGDAAADIALRAHALLSTAELKQGVSSLLQQLHQALHGSRGAAATLCLVGDRTLEIAGVGNVEFKAFGSHVTFILTPGILGARFRSPRVFRAALSPGSRLVLHSDGIRGRFQQDEVMQASVEETCDTLLRDHARSNDDAAIIVAEVM